MVCELHGSCVIPRSPQWGPGKHNRINTCQQELAAASPKVSEAQIMQMWMCTKSIPATMLPGGIVQQKAKDSGAGVVQDTPLLLLVDNLGTLLCLDSSSVPI